jgi:hypothetical protein
LESTRCQGVSCEYDCRASSQPINDQARMPMTRTIVPNTAEGRHGD